MLSRKVSSLIQLQFSKNSISFSRFNNINYARHTKLQSFVQPIIPTRWCQASSRIVRDTSYPFDWRRKEYPIPKLPTPELMPDEVDSTIIGSDMPIIRENIGKIVNYTPEDVTRIFPEGLSGTLVEDLEDLTEGNVGVLIRDTTLQAISYLERSQQEGFQKPYLFLDGREGCGKSMALNQAVHWARGQGWLVLFVNSGFNFMRGNFIERSKIFPEMFEQPELGEHLLKGFLAAHGEQIKTLKLRTEFAIEGFERNENSTIYDLCKWAVDYEEALFSCAAVYHLRRELNLVTEFPVLIVVDGVNFFHDHSTTFFDPLDEENPAILRSPPLHGDKLLLAHIFRNYKKSDLINGTQLISISHYPNRQPEFMNGEFGPDRDSVLQVPKYTKAEFSALINYYSKAGLITDDLPSRTRDYAYYLNEGLGSSLMNYVKLVN